MFPFKTLEEKYRAIPDDVREAISSSEVNRKLRDLTDKYKLQFDEAEDLTKEIGFVMLGLKSPDNFVKNIQKATALDSKTSTQIAEDVNNTIFKDIRKSIRQIHSKPSEENSRTAEQIETDEELEELGEQRMRAELIKEIENPAEKTTDLIKIPQDKKEPSLSNIKQKEITENNKQPPEQKQPEKVIIDSVRDKKSKTSVISNGIDPYREQID
ncbi:MAG: hypothetical protein KAV41_03430 [Candidatus Pacebacteria bacterium]|nr:hypothetical protein [Candidatus Paceibacterota bacterium]